ncbi:peptidoglycan-binding domain-containing protein [Streptomonospora sediminis]
MATGARRAAAVIASGALALTAAFGAATAASADRIGDKDPALAEQINQLPWEEYTQGDAGFVTRGIQYLLAERVGYNPGADGFDGVYDSAVTRAVKKFQRDVEIPVTGNVDAETWNELRAWYGEVPPPTEGHKVSAAQSWLVKRGYLSEGDIDGIWGPVTEGAVKDFQANTCDPDTNECLDDDGIVGPITFRALVTGGV